MRCLTTTLQCLHHNKHFASAYVLKTLSLLASPSGYIFHNFDPVNFFFVAILFSLSLLDLWLHPTKCPLIIIIMLACQLRQNFWIGHDLHVNCLYCNCHELWKFTVPSTQLIKRLADQITFLHAHIILLYDKSTR